MNFFISAARFHEGQHLALVVGRTAAEDHLDPVFFKDLGIEWIIVPQFQRINGLDIIMGIEQNMRAGFVGSVAVMANDHRVSGGFVNARVDSDAIQFVGNPFGSLLAFFLIVRIGRNGFETDQSDQAFEGIIEIGVDLRQNGIKICHEITLSERNRPALTTRDADGQDAISFPDGDASLALVTFTYVTASASDGCCGSLVARGRPPLLLPMCPDRPRCRERRNIDIKIVREKWIRVVCASLGPTFIAGLPLAGRYIFRKL